MEATGSWRFARFERDTRYYELRLQQDLFGWVIVKVWGRKSSRLGQSTVQNLIEKMAMAPIMTTRTL